MFRFVVLCAIVGAVVAQDVKVSVNSEDALGSGLKVLLRLYDDCAAKPTGLSGCLKMRAITFFDRAARAPEIPIMDSVVLVKSASSEPATGRAMTESDLEAELPKDNEDARDGQLDTMLMDRMAKFFSSRQVRLNFPKVTGEDLARSFGEEGRKKGGLGGGHGGGGGHKGGHKGGMMGMMMMGLGMKMAGLVPLIIGKLFLMASKALIISKIALVLALILALKKILASKQGHHHEVEHHDHHGQGWDRRAIDQASAHDQAYSAHVKQN